LIYRHRKKVKDIKEYIKPYNPKTDDQDIQRDYLKNAVLAWKTDGYSDLDIEAWKLYASLQKKNLSGYNMFIREKINAEKDGKRWTKLTNCIIMSIETNYCFIRMKVTSDQLGILYIGTSKYSMLKEYEMNFMLPEYWCDIEDLTKDTKYYFYIANTAVGEAARTGIYTFKTLKD